MVREDVGQTDSAARATDEGKGGCGSQKRAKNNSRSAVSQISGSGLIFLTFFILVAVIFVDSRLARLAKVEGELLKEIKDGTKHLQTMRRYYEPQEALPPPLALGIESQPERESLRVRWS